MRTRIIHGTTCQKRTGSTTQKTCAPSATSLVSRWLGPTLTLATACLLAAITTTSASGEYVSPFATPRGGGLALHVDDPIILLPNARRNVIDALFKDPEYCAARARHRATYDPSDKSYFWGSEEAERLNKAANDKLFHENTITFEMGFNFAQPYNNCTYSVGFVFVRPIDVPEREKSNRRFTKLVSVICGPSEPKNIDAYIIHLLQDLQNLGPRRTRR